MASRRKAYDRPRSTTSASPSTTSTSRSKFYRDVLGLHVHALDTVEDQGVRAALLTIGESEIELLEPTRPDANMAKFLERKGEGLHHICFQTRRTSTATSRC